VASASRSEAHQTEIWGSFLPILHQSFSSTEHIFAVGVGGCLILATLDREKHGGDKIAYEIKLCLPIRALLMWLCN
jgi:hypothetical protein